MADNIERLAVLIEANTKSYENAMKRLEGITKRTTDGIGAGFDNSRTKLKPFEDGLKKTHATAGAMSTQLMAASHAGRGFTEMMLQGVSPARALAMEFNNISYALSGPGGIKGLMASVEQVTGISSKMLLIGGAFGAAALAAYELYSVIATQEPTTEQLLSRQKDIIDQVKAAYTGADNAAGKFFDHSKAALTLFAEVNADQLSSALQKQMKLVDDSMRNTALTSFREFMNQLGHNFGAVDLGTPDIQSKFAPFKQAIQDFEDSVASGAPAVKDLEDRIARLAEASGDPRLKKIADQLLNSDVVKTAIDLANALEKDNSAIAKLKGHATKSDNERLGISTKSSISSYQSLIKATKDQIEEFQFEAQHAGEAGHAIDGLKKEHELLRAALKSGLPDTQKTRDAVKGLADAYAEAKTNAAAAKIIADARFQRSALGMTPEEVQVQSQLRAAGVDASSAIGQAAASELRLNQALAETKDMAKSALSTFVSDLQQGKSGADALRDALTGIEGKLLDMVENQALAALFGGGFGGKGGGGGFNIFSGIASLFSGFFADGGYIPPGQWGIAGEKGAEPVFGGRTGATVVSASAANGNAKGVTILDQSTHNYTAGIGGSDAAMIKSWIRQDGDRREAKIKAWVQTRPARRAS